MAFWFKKRKDVIDLTERYKQQQEKIAEEKEKHLNSPGSSESSFGQGFDIFGSMANANLNSSNSDSSSLNSSYLDISSNVEEKRKKLAKRIMAMTEKLEDLSNQIYHLQQRVEVLEKKAGRF